MTLTVPRLADRVGHLAATLSDLKDRVRNAVATETGRIVADAVRDVLTAALTARVYRPSSNGYYPRREYEADRDGWQDEDDEPGRGWEREVRHDEPTEPCRGTSDQVVVASSRWPEAVALGSAAVRWWAARRLPGWAALGLGLAVGAINWAGGPLARAGLVLLAAAADLLPIAASTVDWNDSAR